MIPTQNNKMPAASNVGSRDTANIVTGVASALLVSPTKLAYQNQKVPSGAIIYNVADRSLRVSDGSTPIVSLPDHHHPLLSPVYHSHITSANEVWRISEPRLWYTDDLHNHPELIPLDGREIPEDQAEFLSRVYPGSTLLTDPCESMDQYGFQNDSMTLKVSSFLSNFTGGTLTGDAIDINNMLTYTDQWFSSSTDINKEQSITIEFKNGYTYSPNEYWLVPAAGITNAPMKERPTPNTWRLEGSNNNGTTWDILDERSDITSDQWRAMYINTYKIEHVTTDYSSIRLVITKWNPIAGEPLETGLRRFWIFGNKMGVFTMPRIDPPNPAFTWVVPYRDLDVGLRHEAIGDVGLTSALPENLPKYRLAANGQSYHRDSYPELFSYVGFTQDHSCTIGAMVGSSGSVLNGNTWDNNITDQHQACYVEIVPIWEDDDAIGGYSLIQSNRNVPLAWILEGATSSGDYELIHNIPNTTSEDMEAQNYKFFVDKNIADKHYTRFRFTFTEWSTQNARTTIKFALFSHKINQFYVPNLKIEGSDNCHAYIVANNTANDISSEVIANLQDNVAKLLEMVATLEAKCNEITDRYNATEE